MKNRIIVGYDGSPSSAAAAEWAAGEAAARSVPLTLLTCHPSRPTVGAAEAMAEDLRRRHPQLSCAAEARIGAPKSSLVAASADADLTVVGKTGATAKTLLVGSVANAVLQHGRGPVVLVPRCAPSRPRSGVIVVGVDGSPVSEPALDWALDEAAIHGAELRIVLAWSYEYTGPAIESAAAHDLACAGARNALDRLVRSATARASGCTVSGSLVEGPPAAALTDAAASADLLVVGSRGHRPLHCLLVGSTARAVAERAQCATALIRGGAAT